MIGIDIVSGFMRCGTTPMVQALEAGGLDPLHDGGGDYELSHQLTKRALLNPQLADGRLLKCLAGGMNQLAAWRWRVVYLHRNYHEIHASCAARFGPGSHVPPEDHYYRLVKYTVDVLKQRRDVTLVEFNYRDVLEDPASTFQLLKMQGWLIDAQAAAGVIDPALCHHKHEELRAAIA